LFSSPRWQRTQGARLRRYDKKGHKKQGSRRQEVSQHSCRSAHRLQKERPVTLTATTYKLVEVYCLRCVSCKLLVPLEKFISYIGNYAILWSYYMWEWYWTREIPNSKTFISSKTNFHGFFGSKTFCFMMEMHRFLLLQSCCTL
jgi:hypothetical protein